LEIQHVELADYFIKHHPTSHHKSLCSTILTSINDPEYRKLFKKSARKEKFNPKIKTLMSTKSFVKNIIQTPRFKTMTNNTLTALTTHSQQRVPKIPMATVC
jgi:hypothetical protein